MSEPSGVARTAFPVTTGLPFAPGALKAGDGLRLLDEQGGEVDLQTFVSAWRADGSIRCVLLDFQSTLPAGGEWGFNIARTRPRGEQSTVGMWRCGFGSMKTPLLYGRIRFDDAGITLDGTAIHNAAAEPRKLTVRAALQPRGVGRIQDVQPVVRQFDLTLARGQALESEDLANLFAEGGRRRDEFRRLIVEALIGGKPVATESWRWNTPPVTGQMIWSRLDETHPRAEVRAFVHATGDKVPLTISLAPAGGAAVRQATRTVASGGEYEFTFPRPAPGRCVLTLAASGCTYQMLFEVAEGRILK